MRNTFAKKLAGCLLVLCCFVVVTNLLLVISSSNYNNNELAVHPSNVVRIADHGMAQRKTQTRFSSEENHTSRTVLDVSGTYKCTYGPGKENRTEVVVPKHTPAFVLIGVQKSGSTSLSSHMIEHPQILQTKLKFRREAHFFDTRWLSWAWKEADRLGLKQSNEKHCLALECYMTLFEQELILANSQTLAHKNDNNKTQQQQQLPLYTFEKSPSYFQNPKVPARMKRTIPWAKAILVLRNPIDRLYSHYKMTILNKYDLRKYSLEDMIYHELKAMKETFRMTNASLPIPQNITSNSSDTISSDSYIFPKGISSNHLQPSDQWTPPNMALVRKPPSKGPLHTDADMVRRGLYAEELSWWLKHYTVGHDLLVVNYSDLCRDTKEVYARVLDFVGIPLPPSLEGLSVKEHRKDHRKDDRPLSAETRSYLSEFYAPYNAQLEGLLGPEWAVDKLQWN